MLAKVRFITPDWPAPAGVHAVQTTRHGGVSQPPYDGFNLASHVGDDPAAVAANRRMLIQTVNLPAEPSWLEQVHGCDLVLAGQPNCRADACYSDQPGQVCAVLTADCLPILLCSKDGRELAAVHAGWRGLAEGVVEKALEKFSCPPAEILAWMGAAIGPDAFEVGDEVRQAFVSRQHNSVAAFRSSRPGHWFCDLFQLAQYRLGAFGVTGVYGAGRCTYTSPHDFYSYRREALCGRMATLIWRYD